MGNQAFFRRNQAPNSCLSLSDSQRPVKQTLKKICWVGQTPVHLLYRIECQLHFSTERGRFQVVRRQWEMEHRFLRFCVSGTCSGGVSKDRRVLANAQVEISLNQLQRCFFFVTMGSIFQNIIPRPNMQKGKIESVLKVRGQVGLSLLSPTPLPIPGHAWCLCSSENPIGTLLM